MTSLVDISQFDSNAEVLMILFNAATAGGNSLMAPMNLEEANDELSRTSGLILFVRSRLVSLRFDGSDMLDCTAYDEANMGTGYAQQVLNGYLLGKYGQHVRSAAV